MLLELKFLIGWCDVRFTFNLRGAGKPPSAATKYFKEFQVYFLSHVSVPVSYNINKKMLIKPQFNRSWYLTRVVTNPGIYYILYISFLPSFEIHFSPREGGAVGIGRTPREIFWAYNPTRCIFKAFSPFLCNFSFPLLIVFPSNYFFFFFELRSL